MSKTLYLYGGALPEKRLINRRFSAFFLRQFEVAFKRAGQELLPTSESVAYAVSRRLTDGRGVESAGSMNA